MTFLGWLSDPFKGLSDLQIGDKKVALNHLVQTFSWDIILGWVTTHLLTYFHVVFLRLFYPLIRSPLIPTSWDIQTYNSWPPAVWIRWGGCYELDMARINENLATTSHGWNNTLPPFRHASWQQRYIFLFRFNCQLVSLVSTLQIYQQTLNNWRYLFWNGSKLRPLHKRYTFRNVTCVLRSTFWDLKLVTFGFGSLKLWPFQGW